MTLVKLVWILFRNLCHLLCQIPWYFGLECYMSCMQSIFCFTHLCSNKSPCFSPINWDCIKWLILIMHMLECYYLSLPWVTRLGTTPSPISWQKRGVVCGKGRCKFVHVGENIYWGGVTLWGGALHTQTLHYVALNFYYANACFYLTWFISLFVLESLEILFQGLIVLQEIEAFKIYFCISLCNVEYNHWPIGFILLWGINVSGGFVTK